MLKRLNFTFLVHPFSLSQTIHISLSKQSPRFCGHDGLILEFAHKWENLCISILAKVHGTRIKPKIRFIQIFECRGLSWWDPTQCLMLERFVQFYIKIWVPVKLLNHWIPFFAGAFIDSRIGMVLKQYEGTLKKVSALDLQTFWEKVHLPHLSCVTYPVSHVMCQVSDVSCDFFSNIFGSFYKVVKLVGGGSFINRSYLV